MLLAYRTAIQDSTGFTPFRIIFGRTPTLPIDLMLPFPEEKGEEDQPSYSEYIKKLKHLLENAYRMVRQTLGASHNRQKEQYDKKTNDVKFMVGVWCTFMCQLYGKEETKSWHLVGQVPIL